MQLADLPSSSYPDNKSESLEKSFTVFPVHLCSIHMHISSLKVGEDAETNL